MEKILAAVDGSESSLHALNQAVNLAVTWSAELCARAVPPLSPLVYMGPAPMYKEQYTKAAKESHQRAHVRLQRAHYTIQFREFPITHV